MVSGEAKDGEVGGNWRKERDLGEGEGGVEWGTRVRRGRGG